MCGRNNARTQIEANRSHLHNRLMTDDDVVAGQVCNRVWLLNCPILPMFAAPATTKAIVDLGQCCKRFNFMSHILKTHYLLQYMKCVQHGYLNNFFVWCVWLILFSFSFVMCAGVCLCARFGSFLQRCKWNYSPLICCNEEFLVNGLSNFR